MADPATQPERWRKKPVEIEAMQWDGSRGSIERACRWVNAEPTGDDPTLSYTFTGADDANDVLIWTLEGDHRVSPGDWIIRGLKGEFYPCKPDIFEATYEPAGAASALDDLRGVAEELAKAIEVALPAFDREYPPLADFVDDCVMVHMDHFTGLCVGVELLKSSLAKCRAALSASSTGGEPEWCPVCKTYHREPGVKTDAGVVTRPCSRSSTGGDDTRG